MSRATIDYGIDLGTTNSSIALFKGHDQLVIENNEGYKYTPSAVYIDAQNKTHVGHPAKDRLEHDPENAFSEFKLQMGTATEYVFARSGRRMRPEDLSAEVLKELKADVKQRVGEDIQAAVITVPAAFELPQCEATAKAAQSAGLSVCPLLQEPVAAALAYGFQSESNKVFWLVYDFGGGTFDAAVVQVRDGQIQVVTHEGDNDLGGKLIDWEIVEQLLIPEVVRRHRLTDFRRGNRRWLAALAKLKQGAEKAKIRVSRRDSEPIIVDPLCQDDRGEPVRFEYELKRKDVEKLAEPFIVRSINICKKALVEKRLGVRDIEKVLLVGGPTLMPYLRNRLEDQQFGLGIPLEFSVDPMTVVARGAAIFAGTQRLDSSVPASHKIGQYTIELEYKPMGVETEPLVGGKVSAPGAKDLNGFTVEFVNADARPQWRSGKVVLPAAGTFVANLWAEKGKPNTFLIELRDAAGTSCEVIPDRLTYTVGLAITDPPLTHSVGVTLADNSVKIFCEKGTPLPARRLVPLRTTVEVRRGGSETSSGTSVPISAGKITIPVVEGQNPRGDRNGLIGSLEISSAAIKRDIPVGTEIEVTIEIDQSRRVRTKAYIPILDEEFEEVFKLEIKNPDLGNLKKEVEQEKQRLEQVRQKAEGVEDKETGQALQRIEEERMVQQVDSLLAAAVGDPDAALKCQHRLLDVRSAIDAVEDLLEWPALIALAEGEIRLLKEVAGQYGDAREKQSAVALEREAGHAMDAHDLDLLRRKIDDVADLRFSILRRQPSFWVGYLHYLEEMRASMRDARQADQWFAQGNRAINNNDLPALRAAVQQLVGLLPLEQQEQTRKAFGSTVL